jgi:hypothetical protein
MTSTLISSPNLAPTVVTVRDGGGCVLSQRRNLIVLDRDELHRLVAACGLGEPVTPAKARLMRYPAEPPEPAPRPANSANESVPAEPADG